MKEASIFRQQARMLVASLKRSGFRGDIKIVHNGATEIFDMPQPNVEEIGIDAPQTKWLCHRVKFKARDLFSVEGYDWVLFLDSDIIVNTGLDSWFTGPEIIRYATEPAFEIQAPQYSALLTDDEMQHLRRKGINSGAFVIKAEYFHETLALWEKLDELESPRGKAGDQHAWNRLLLDTKLPTRRLVEPEVKYFYHNNDFLAMLRAPVLHYCGCDDGEKVLAMQAKFVSHFHTDGDGTLIRLLER
jgi:lipopolysaccharide biosynthesis glycosyltransferase